MTLRIMPKPAPGQRLHTCSACKSVDLWSDSWSWYGSMADWDDGRPLIKACCAACRRALAANGIIPIGDEPCDNCDGSGKLRANHQRPGGPYVFGRITCHTCGGSGRVNTNVL